jgi:peptidoglycan/LPS O-acetylase OafA/YrhL
MKQNRVPQIDGVRGVAILLIVLTHYVCNISGNKTVEAVLGLAWTGVDLFFVLSGYLIGGILIENREAPNYYRVFYIRRALRILPLYLMVLALFYTFRTEGKGWDFVFGNGFQLWHYITFTQNFAVAATASYGSEAMAATWSLAIEEQFYLLLPFLVRKLTPRRLIVCCVGMIALAPVSRVLMFAIHPHPLLACYALAPCRFDSLFLGVLIAALMRLDGFTAWVRARAGWLSVALACLFAGMVTMHFKSPLGTKVVAIFGYTWIAMFYGAILLCAVAIDGRAARLFRVGFLQRMGLVAYGLYLIHWPMLGIVFALAGRDRPVFDWGLVYVAALGTVVVAWVSYRWLELPAMNFGRRWKYLSPHTHPSEASPRSCLPAQAVSQEESPRALG